MKRKKIVQGGESEKLVRKESEAKEKRCFIIAPIGDPSEIPIPTYAVVLTKCSNIYLNQLCKTYAVTMFSEPTKSRSPA